jgi:hemerythrin-like domain-containing protein
VPIAIGQALESDFHNPLGMLSDCHRRIARFLETLITITEEAGGASLNDEQRQALRASLKYFREAAPKHTADEEDSLFPRMRKRADASGRFALLTVLHADHVAVVTQHDAVEELGCRWLSDDRVSADDAQRLLDLLHGLREMYQEHIEIEETKIFPFAAKILTPLDLHDIGKEMAHRRGLLPVGIG